MVVEKVNLKTLAEIVAKHYRVPTPEILGRNGTRPIVTARMAFVGVALGLRVTHSQLARVLGKTHKCIDYYSNEYPNRVSQFTLEYLYNLYILDTYIQFKANLEKELHVVKEIIGTYQALIENSKKRLPEETV